MQVASELNFERSDPNVFFVAPSVRYTQPLLRGAGASSNLANVNAAELRTRAAELELQLRSIQLVSDVETAYLNLYLEHQNVRIVHWTIVEARRQLAWFESRAEAGLGGAADVFRSQNGLNDLELQLRQALENARLAERILKELILSQLHPWARR